MSDAAAYRDIRQDFFRSYFEKGAGYDEYLAKSPPQHVKKWGDYQARISLKNTQFERISLFTRKMNVLVLSGVWCGDCARQGPMLRLIEQANPVLTMKYIDNRENAELQDELRLNGAAKVPVVVTLSEDFFEISRFGDRHLSVYRRKVQAEAGPACDPGLGSPEADLAAEVEEWVSHFERLQGMLRLSPMLRKRYND